MITMIKESIMSKENTWLNAFKEGKAFTFYEADAILPKMYKVRLLNGGTEYWVSRKKRDARVKEILRIPELEG